MEKYVKVFLELSKFRSNYSARSRIGGTSSRSWRMSVRSSHPSPPLLETSLHTSMTSSSLSTRTSLRLSSDVQTRLGGMILYSAKLKLSRWGKGRTISQDNEIFWLLDVDIHISGKTGQNYCEELLNYCKKRWSKRLELKTSPSNEYWCVISSKTSDVTFICKTKYNLHKTLSEIHSLSMSL